jgi:hypothetical protein
MCSSSHPVCNDHTVLTLNLITIPSLCPRCLTVADNEARRPSTLLTLTPGRSAVMRRGAPQTDACWWRFSALGPSCRYINVGAGSHDDAHLSAATGTANADAPFAEALGSCHIAVDVSFMWQMSTFESRYRPYWLRRSAAGLWHKHLGFDCRPFRVRFVVHEAALWQAVLTVLRFSSVITIPPLPHIPITFITDTVWS